jgi:6-phosphogluconolactonase
VFCVGRAGRGNDDPAPARRRRARYRCARTLSARARRWAHPLAVYRRLVEPPADWARWHLFFGDERCLPAGDPERNSLAARAVWLDRVPIPPDNVHPIRAELGAEPAAAHYAELIRDRLPFDLVLLGLGEDGHTASLFPGHAIQDAALVMPVHDAPKPPADRVSLTPWLWERVEPF